MKLIAMGQEIPCVRAAKDESAGMAAAWDARGNKVFSAEKVTDFSAFAVEGGEWSPLPLTDSERMDALEELVAGLLFGGGGEAV